MDVCVKPLFALANLKLTMAMVSSIIFTGSGMPELITILGAGDAGLCIEAELSARGAQIQVIEPNGRLVTTLVRSGRNADP